MSWQFLHPVRLWWLFGVLALAGGYVAAQVIRRQRAVKFTNVDLLDAIAPKRPSWRRWIVVGLTLVGFAIGVLGLAQPYRKEQAQENRSIIMLALDVSLSMQAEDVAPNRFDAARAQAKLFVDQIDPSIEAGLVSFSKDVRLRVPPTLKRDSVLDGIDRLRLGEGTAIGDAIITTTDVIVGEFRADEPPATDAPTGDAGGSGPSTGPLADGGPPAAIVILTDGETAEGLTPGEEGAKAAAAAGIPVYGIAFGTPDGTITYNDPFQGPVTEPVPVKYDELTSAAEQTGGKFYAAESTGDLAEVYADIEARLEPALKQPEPITVELTIRYLAVALGLLALAVALGQWWLGGMT